MQIKVKGYLTYRDKIGGNGELVLDMEHATVKDVLLELSERFGKEFNDCAVGQETRTRRRRNLVLVDGRNCRLLEKGLDTSLEDGSMVSIFPPVAGG